MQIPSRVEDTEIAKMAGLFSCDSLETLAVRYFKIPRPQWTAWNHPAEKTLKASKGTCCFTSGTNLPPPEWYKFSVDSSGEIFSVFSWISGFWVKAGTFPISHLRWLNHNQNWNQIKLSTLSVFCFGSRRNLAKIKRQGQDFGQGVPAEFWPQGAWTQNFLKNVFYSLNIAWKLYDYEKKSCGGKGYPAPSTGVNSALIMCDLQMAIGILSTLPPPKKTRDFKS